jgi:hypothetical protein
MPVPGRPAWVPSHEPSRNRTRAHWSAPCAGCWPAAGGNVSSVRIPPDIAQERLRACRLHLRPHADRHSRPGRSPLGAELDKGGCVAWTEELERVDDRQVPDVQDGSPVVHRKVDGAPSDVKCPEETRWQDAAVEVIDL